MSANTPKGFGAPIIEVRGVSRSFRSVEKEEGMAGALKLLFKPKHKTHEALKDINFSIESGSFVGLIGANGAGKTTLLKILAGLIPATSGEARVMGFDPFKRSIDFRRQISLVMGQKAQLWWDLPAIDAFNLVRAIYEIPEKTYRERLDHLSELLDVKRMLTTQIRRLSLGERMKMELIGAILHWPKVIYLDEPTIGLDTLAAHKLREFLRVFNEREKATIILTSHNMDDIERLCSRVIILRSGQLIYDGRPGGLTRETERQLRIRFREARDPADLARVSGIAPNLIEVVAAEEEGTPPTANFTVAQDQIVPTLQKLMAAFPIVDMGIESESLERVIHRIYEEEKKA